MISRYAVDAVVCCDYLSFRVVSCLCCLFGTIVYCDISVYQKLAFLQNNTNELCQGFSPAGEGHLSATPTSY